jgi:uncharacterized protein (TIGR02118 family)
MPCSRTAFLGGAALLGVTGLLPEAAVAAVGDKAIALTLWAKPKDPDAFEKYYVSTHEPLVKQLPGITSYERSTGPVTTESSKPSPFQMITVIGFDTMDALKEAIESSAGAAMLNDLKNFAADTSILFFSATSA